MIYDNADFKHYMVIFMGIIIILFNKSSARFTIDYNNWCYKFFRLNKPPLSDSLILYRIIFIVGGLIFVWIGGIGLNIF